MKLRPLLIATALVSGAPAAVLTAQFLGSALPLVPACIAAAIICGGGSFLLFRACWQLIRD